jgi:hypothetical protein
MLLLAVVAIFVLAFGAVVFIGAPYVPTLKKDIDKAFDDLYPVDSGDVVVDIGSGDGKVLRAAASRGARTLGYEINPFLAGISMLLSIGKPRISTRLDNIWVVQFPADTTLVYVFTTTRDAKRISQKIQNEVERIGTDLHVMSYGATLPGGTHQRTAGAHHLYLYKALHNKKPQV